MCECICSEVDGLAVFQTAAKSPIVCADLYPGCSDCEPIIGVDIRVFTRGGWRDISEDKVQTITPDDMGGENGGIPISIPIIHARALREAVREHLGDEFAEMLDDERDALRVLQTAIRLTAKEFPGNGLSR